MNNLLKLYMCAACMQNLAIWACVGQAQSYAVNGSSLLQTVSQKTHGAIAQLANRCSLDVVLVLDTSGSVGEDFGCGGCFNKMKEAATQFVKDLQEHSTASRVALVTFDANARRQSGLSSDFNSVIAEIGDIPSPAGGTHLADGLTKALGELSASPKEQDQKVILLITDGQPTVPGDANCNAGTNWNCVTAQEQAKDAADNLKTEARLTIVGVGAATHTGYMQSLATAPPTDNFYPIDNFRGLTDSFIEKLLKDLCQTPSPTPEATPSPPTPPPTVCRKDTEAPCFQGLCFQRTRGSTTCNPTTDTCWCVEQNECVFDRKYSTTRGTKWSVCRASEDDKRGEENVAKWMTLVSQDIVSAYWEAATNSLR
jgi:Mg-chelatase subunit ChlD